MVNSWTVDAATANVTDTTFAQKLSLIDGPFGLQELQSTLSFPPRDGMSWNISIRTSDIAAVVFIILVLTFAIDHYFFKSRYLVHIGGAKRVKDHTAILDEKASLHEKEALKVESGQKGSNDEDTYQELKSEQGSESPRSTTFSRWTHRAICMLLISYDALVSDGKLWKEMAPTETAESSHERAEVETGLENSWTGWWRKTGSHSRAQAPLSTAVTSLTVLFMLAAIGFQFLFWILILTLVILHQGLFYEELNPGTTVPWKPIAIKSILHFAVWTIICVGLLLKPGRLQGVLWKCLKWTHAVNWWFFWFIFETYYCGKFVAEWITIPSTGITTLLVLFILQPTLVAYLYSGAVRDALVAVRLCKYFWSHDVMHDVMHQSSLDTPERGGI